MIVNVVKNITCQANKTGWTQGVQITLVQRSKRLRGILIWIAKGASNQVQVQIRKGGTIFLPDPTIFKSDPRPIFGDYITGDGDTFYFNMDSEIKKSETYEVYYRNTDGMNTHDIQVAFELHDLPTEKSQLRS